MVDRAAIGLGSVFMRIEAEINWHQLFHSLVDTFDSDKMQTRQRAAMVQATLDPALSPCSPKIS